MKQKGVDMPDTEEYATLDRYVKRLMEPRKGIEETEANLCGDAPL